MLWLIYGPAAVMMLTVVVGMILAELALWVVAEFLRGAGRDPPRGEHQEVGG